MIRLLSSLSLVLCACSDNGSNRADVLAEEDEYYESSGTAFNIEPAEIDTVVDAALNGDDEQLERLIDFYMFSAEDTPQNGVLLQRWLAVGAERELKGTRYNLLYLAAADIGPDCSAIREHLGLLPQDEQEALTSFNPYVAGCRLS
jgi:hypothetical protein